MRGEIENIEKKKKHLILSLMQCKFEQNMAELIEENDFESMDELDYEVDRRLRRFYEECDAVAEYYDKKIYS